MPPRKKKSENTHLCPRCGSLMNEIEAGRQCPTCLFTEWIQEDGTYTSGMAKCPACGNISPNIIMCSYCSYPIDEKMKKYHEQYLERQRLKKEKCK